MITYVLIHTKNTAQEWNDFFEQQYENITYNASVRNRFLVNFDRIYVLSCQFNIVEESDTGGAICFTSLSDTSKLLIEQCIFDNCHTSNARGGAIFMARSTSSGSGSCVINKCCSNNCSSNNSGSSYGQFIFTYLSDSISQCNNVFDSSIINSQPPGSNSGGTLYLNRGNVTIYQLNISNNRCSRSPSVYCFPFSIESQLTCLVSYGLISDNIGNQYGISFAKLGATCMMISCNIIKNNCSQLIRNYGVTNIIHCAIFSNFDSSPIFSSSS